MLNKYKMIALLITVMSFLSANAQTYPVNWVKFRQAEVVAGVLQRTTSAQNVGVGTSQQQLFGFGESNIQDGYIEYTTSNASDLKKLGFAVVNADGEISGGITYGFTFVKNSKVRALTPEGASSKIAYASGDVFKIERSQGSMNFYINGSIVHTVRVDIFESLKIRAQLRSVNSTFDNVVCSFNTTTFCVLPEIDNVNKTIKLAISGAYPPYVSVWANGTTVYDIPTRFSTAGAPTQHFYMDGNYPLTIKDAQGNLTHLLFSVGNDVTWSGFFNSIATGDVLSYSGSGNGWGAAVYSNSFESSSDAWVEYIIEQETGGRKAFGFSDASKVVRKTRHLKAGYLISKDNLQIIENGNIVLTVDYDDKDALNISYSNGDVTWLKNGIELHASTYVQNGDVTIAGLVRGNGTLKHLTYDANPETVISTTWDDLTETGTIAVDVTSAGMPGPYHYIISEEAVPDLSDIYSFLRDSVDLPIDSIEFFTGNFSDVTHVFSNLKAGAHFITVFDSQNNRLFGKEIQLQGEFVFETQTGLTSQGEIITASLDPSYGSIDLYIQDGENGEMGFEVSKVNGNREQFFGLVDEATTVSSSASLIYGFHLVGRKMYTIENGVESTGFTRINKNYTFGIVLEDGQIILKANDQELTNTALPASFAYKMAVGGEPGSTINAKSGLSKHKLRFISTVLQHLKCDGSQQGSFQFDPTTPSPAQIAMTYSVINQTTGVVLENNTAGFTNEVVIITPPVGSEPLSAGIYLITVTIPGSAPFTHEICLGYETDWANLYLYDELPTPHSTIVRPAPPTGFEYALGRSNNIMKFNEEGWIEFTVTTAAFSGANLFRFTSENLNTQPGAAFLNSEDFIAFASMGFGGPSIMYVFDDVNGLVDWKIVQPNSRMKLRLTTDNLPASPNGIVEIYDDGDQISELNRGNATVLSRCNTLKWGDGFERVTSSFACPEVGDQFAHLEYELDGYYHVMKDGKINFIFDQEYDTDNLKFKIFNKTNFLIKTDVDFGSVTTTHGDNYLTLDVTDDIECLGKGFFHLEVTNSKKEKLYLRFYNDYSDCIPSVTEPEN